MLANCGTLSKQTLQSWSGLPVSIGLILGTFSWVLGTDFSYWGQPICWHITTPSYSVLVTELKNGRFGQEYKVSLGRVTMGVDGDGLCRSNSLRIIIMLFIQALQLAIKVELLFWKGNQQHYCETRESVNEVGFICINPTSWKTDRIFIICRHKTEEILLNVYADIWKKNSSLHTTICTLI